MRKFKQPFTYTVLTESVAIQAANGLGLAYIYFEDIKGRRDEMNRLTREEAIWMAEQIIRLPELLEKERKGG